MTVLSFAAVCAATAFCCTCVKEDGADKVASGTLRLFMFLVVGIGFFAAIIQVFTALAG